MVICLERGADLHVAQLMPLPLASLKSRLVLPFWYRLTRMVPNEGPLNVCVCVCVCACLGYGGRDDYDRGYGGRGYDRDYDDRDRYMSRRGWDDGTPPTLHPFHLMIYCLLCLRQPTGWVAFYLWYRGGRAQPG